MSILLGTRDVRLPEPGRDAVIAPVKIFDGRMRLVCVLTEEQFRRRYRQQRRRCRTHHKFDCRDCLAHQRVWAMSPSAWRSSPLLHFSVSRRGARRLRVG